MHNVKLGGFNVMKFKKFIYVLIGMAYSLTVFADGTNPITCSDFQVPLEIKQRISSFNQKFQWNNSNCKIVATKSIFPKEKNNVLAYERGFQVFIYQDDQLKYICLPGWVCKAW